MLCVRKTRISGFKLYQGRFRLHIHEKIHSSRDREVDDMSDESVNSVSQNVFMSICHGLIPASS